MPGRLQKRKRLAELDDAIAAPGYGHKTGIEARVVKLRDNPQGTPCILEIGESRAARQAST